MKTNFVNFSIQNKLDIVQAMMDCLYAKCIPYITDCVMGELEKLGTKFRVAVRVAKDPRFRRLTCKHKGTYADDCLVSRVEMHKCYIVATCDKDLKRRIRKIPGVPIMYIRKRKYSIERMPEAYGGEPFRDFILLAASMILTLPTFISPLSLHPRASRTSLAPSALKAWRAAPHASPPAAGK